MELFGRFYKNWPEIVKELQEYTYKEFELENIFAKVALLKRFYHEEDDTKNLNDTWSKQICDIIVAVHCIEHNAKLITRNRRHFPWPFFMDVGDPKLIKGMIFAILKPNLELYTNKRQNLMKSWEGGNS